MPDTPYFRRLMAEALGTAFLVATVVGSGIMAETLADGNAAVALIGNTLATGAILVVLILVLGPVSAAHFNPAVTLAFALRKLQPWRETPGYMAAQIIGGMVGLIVAHAMFDQELLQYSTHARTGGGQWLGEIVASFGLVGAILMLLRSRAEAIPWAVGLYISAGYWFTSSTSFANPAVAIARAFTDTFSGIRPADMPAFVAAEFIGAALAAVGVAWLLGRDKIAEAGKPAG